MQRIIDATAVVSLPAPPALSGSTGYFAEGVPGVSAATRVRAWWANMVQEEIMSVLVAGGVTPDTTGTSFAQLLAAINALIATEATARTAAIVAEATARAAAVTAEATTRNTQMTAEGNARALIFSTANNVTTSRALGTNYTNSTGRQMFVSAWGVTTGASANLNLTVSGITVFSMGQVYSGADIAASGLVPAGAVYQVFNSGGGVTLSAWVES